jgi:hypothetical protein
MKVEQILTHVGIGLVLLIAAVLYFKPVVFDNKSLGEHDNVQARAMQTELKKYQKSEGKVPKWTNQVFVGMPSYQIFGSYRNNYVGSFARGLRLWAPVNVPHPVMFLMMLLSYLGLLAMRVNKWLALFGAMSFGFMTNNLVLFEAGHSTKLHAMAYIAAVLGGLVMALRGKRILLGAAIFCFALAAQIAANHLQITYYTLLIGGIIGLAYFVEAAIKSRWLQFAKAAGLLAAGAGLAIMCNLSPMWTTYEYSQETIRGKSELTTFVLNQEDVSSLAAKGMTPENITKLNQSGIVDQGIKVEKFYLDRIKSIIGENSFNKFKQDLLALGKSKPTKGLDKDYIFAWSYGKMETFTLLLPNFYGGANGRYFAMDEKGQLNKESNSGKEIQNMMARVTNPQQQNQIANQLIQLTSKYWGDQPFTSGPVYFGAIIFMLMMLGLYMSKGPLKWGLGISLLFLIVLGWGRNFEAFNYFMVDYFPMYNKFRAVTMALSVAQILAAILAVMGLSAFINFEKNQQLASAPKGFIMPKLFAAMGQKESRALYLYFAFGTTALLCLIALFYSYGSLEGANDAKTFGPLLKQAPQWAPLVEAIKEDRGALIRSDVLRAFIFLILGAGVMWAFATKKFKEGWIVIASLGFLTLIDLVQIDLTYVNKDSFVKKSRIAEVPPATKADQQVLGDKDPHFRVFDLIAGSRARGGGQGGNPFANAEGAFYHKIIGGYHAAKPILLQEVVETYVTGNAILTDKRHILEMLNVKYIINSPEQAVQTGALGNAWFVDKVDLVENADAEMVELGGLTDARSRAVTQKKNAAYLEGLSNTASNGDYIRLTSYHPEKLSYESKSGAERFAVFSEIYYPPAKGWNVYIDGQKVDQGFIKVNYLLRGMRVPAGTHKIEFVFEPRSHAIGETMALIASFLIFGFFGFAVYRAIKNPIVDEENPGKEEI